VAAGEVSEERVEASDRSVDVTGDVVEDEPDVGQAQVRAAQQADELPGADLSGSVAPVARSGQ
jgi:hypothetical protein